MAYPKTSALLKVVNGSAARNPERLRDEQAVKPPGNPIVPEYHALSDDAKKIYDWWVEHLKHWWIGEIDGAGLCLLADTIAQRNIAHAKVEKFGQVIRDPKTNKPVLSPYFRAADHLENRIRMLMAELGLTPVSRLKFAPPLAASRDKGQPTSWDELK